MPVFMYNLLRNDNRYVGEIAVTWRNRSYLDKKQDTRRNRSYLDKKQDTRTTAKPKDGSIVKISLAGFTAMLFV